MSKSAHSGTLAAPLAGVTWRKSRYSGRYGNCVEIASVGSGDVAIRNSRYRSGPALTFSRDEITAFLASAKDGEFDDVAV
jgi:Domain of unknown function (DUF397)